MSEYGMIISNQNPYSCSQSTSSEVLIRGFYKIRDLLFRAKVVDKIRDWRTQSASLTAE